MSASSRRRRESDVEAASGTLPLTYERKVWAAGPSHLVIGVDEAGRGPLAGPVVAAACCIVRHKGSAPPVAGIDDSKKISDEATREQLYTALTSHADVVYGVSCLDHAVIDEINILQAAMLAMELAVADLQRKLPPACNVVVLVDGPRVPSRLADAATMASVSLPDPSSLGSLPYLETDTDAAAGAMPRPATLTLQRVGEAQPLVQGDAKCYSIAAASIIAKVTRDRHMHALARVYPLYRFEQHKGYGVPAHVAAIHEHGPCDIHRRTFAPVKHMVAAVTATAPKKRARSVAAGGTPLLASKKAKQDHVVTAAAQPAAVAAAAAAAADEEPPRRRSTRRRQHVT